MSQSLVSTFTVRNRVWETNVHPPFSTDETFGILKNMLQNIDVLCLLWEMGQNN